MRYNGGKKRIAKKIAPLIQRYNPVVYWEPFCGMCSVGLLIEAQLKFFSDLDESVITILRYAINGGEFPESLSESEYRKARNLPPTHPIHGFAKFGCSYAGKPWGGYARSNDRNYALNAKNALKIYKGRTDMTLIHGNYKEVQFPKQPNVIYCDPPYSNTTSVGINKKFNHEEFWEWAESQTATVLVSEYISPDNWIDIFSEEITDGLIPSKRSHNIEKLFVKR